MPEREATKIIGNPVFMEKSHGAHYYAYSDVSTAYTKASATIILPPVQSNNNPGVKNTPSANSGAQYTKRNAFISLGVTTSNDEGVDLGLINIGTGWHPVYYDTAYTEAEKKAGAQASQTYPTYTEPNAAKAAIAIMPISQTQAKLYIQFIDKNGAFLKKFEQNIDLKRRTGTWNRFYRFASLVQDPQDKPDVLTDSTYMIKGQFTELKLWKGTTTVNWGLNNASGGDSPYVTSAWIMSHPKCQILSRGTTSETFSIDHWA